MHLNHDDLSFRQPYAGTRKYLLLSALNVALDEIETVNRQHAREGVNSEGLHLGRSARINLVIPLRKFGFFRHVAHHASSIRCPGGSLDGDDVFVRLAISYQCDKVLRLWLDGNHFRQRILARKQCAAHTTVGSKIEDGFRRKRKRKIIIPFNHDLAEYGDV